MKTYFFYAGSAEDFTPDPIEPVVFRLGKLAKAGVLERTAKRIKVSTKGVPTEVSLHESSNPARIVRFVFKRKGDDREQRREWMLIIEIPGGGILLSTNEFQTIAPREEYLNAVSLPMNPSDPNGP